MARSQFSVEITEQPAKMYRFRYLSEIERTRNRSLTSIKGASSSSTSITYPTIRVTGYEGPFLVMLSLVNAWNNLVHPHSIKSSNKRYKNRNGIIYYFADKPVVQFYDIGIICVKGKSKESINEALEPRKLLNIDPFQAGFAHIDNHRLIDLSAVRLCFQVFLPGKDWTLADPRAVEKYNGGSVGATSTVIYDDKKHGLKIVYFAGPVVGGKEMHLWCNKYTGPEPEVVFEDQIGWSEKATYVVNHQKAAMRFEPPRYPKNPESVYTDIKVAVHLRQETQSGETIRSNPVHAVYIWRDPKRIPPDYLPKKNAKNVDEIIEECRALESLHAMPSTSRASDHAQLLPASSESSNKSPTIIGDDKDASDKASNEYTACVAADNINLNPRAKNASNEAESKAGPLTSTVDLELGSITSNDNMSFEEVQPYNKEENRYIQDFDVSLL